MKKISIVLAALILLGSCREDTIEIRTYGRLTGEVLDAESLLPIAGASVTTNPESDLDITNELGEFLIDSLLEGSYSIRARSTGYDDGIISVQVEGDRITSVTLLLSRGNQENNPPSLPTVLAPDNGAQNIVPNLTLAWAASDVDGDSLSYDVYLFPSDTSSAIPLALGSRDTFLELSNLGFNRRYYWQVAVNDGVNAPVYGEVWSFSVQEYPIDEYRFAFVRPVNGNLTLFAGKAPDGATVEELSFQLTDGSRSYWRPRLRPLLRNEMAALHLVGAETHISIMNRDGSNPQRVTTNVPIRSKDEYPFF